MSCAGSPAEGIDPQEPLQIASVTPLVPAWRVDRSFDYRVPKRLHESVGPGVLVRVPFGGRRVRAVVASVGVSSSEHHLQEIAGVVLSDPIVAPPLDELARWIARRYVTPVATALERFVPPRVRIPASSTGDSQDAGPTPRRVAAYEGGPALLRALESGAAGTWCFQALPGDSRSDIVAELVAAALRGRGAALVGAAEIAFGSPLLTRLSRAVPGLVRVDSGVSDAERAQSMLRAARGHRVVGGGRAVVFTSAPRLRMVLLDDEHHPSYKDDRSPRIDARRVAVERARLQGAVCVLLSAAPSLETAAAAQGGEIGWVRPDKEAARAARPLVEVVQPDPDRPVSHLLHERIRDTLRSGRRVGLLAPSRGYARAVWCSGCRRSVRCPRCEAGMSYERAAHAVRCPRCAYGGRAPESCPSCGAPALRYMGAGSERLQEQLRMAFPRARVGRVDPDVIDDAAAAREADIYVTTWIGTKRSLRPEVGLVGVLDADALIRRPDFRAAEHACQALVEMAEWAGPASAGGRLVVHTSEPAHPAVQAVVRGDYSFFVERELPLRAELGYPPYRELIRITATGGSRDAAIASALEAARAAGATALGPIPAGGGRKGGLEALLKCPDAQDVATVLRDILAEPVPGGLLRVDVDPR